MPQHCPPALASQCRVGWESEPLQPCACWRRKGLDPAPALCGFLVTAGTEGPPWHGCEGCLGPEDGASRRCSLGFVRRRACACRHGLGLSVGPHGTACTSSGGNHHAQTWEMQDTLLAGDFPKLGEGYVPQPVSAMNGEGMGQSCCPQPVPPPGRPLKSICSPTHCAGAGWGTAGMLWDASGMQSGMVPGGERAGSAAPVGSASPRSPPVPVTAGRDPPGAGGWPGAGLSPLPPSSRGVKNSARVMNM